MWFELIDATLYFFLERLRVSHEISPENVFHEQAEAKNQAVPGYWEGNLIGGSGNSFIATLVARKMRYVMLAKVGNTDSHSVIQALIKQVRKLPKELYRSLT